MIYGGRDGNGRWIGDLVWALTLDGTPQWLPLSASPTGRHLSAGAYDPVGDRFIVFGGYDGDSSRSDLWALTMSNQRWERLAPAGQVPDARSGHSAIYDPVRNRVVVFAGNQGMTRFADTWELSLSGSALYLREAPMWVPLPTSDDRSFIY